MIYSAVSGLIKYAAEKNLITEDDIFVVRNQLMDILKLTEWKDESALCGSIEEILGEILNYAVENGITEDTSVQRDLFDTKIMGVFTPFPREVNAEFRKRYSVSPECATDWYYDFSKNLNYVRAERIAKDIKWQYKSGYGKLDITINCSKPEKDPRDIAAARNHKASSYPECQLCAENMGFAGHLTHPARQNLRPVNVQIQNKKWYLQYSPYGYYNEHCILLNSEHTPMVIDRSVFEKLFDFAEQFPHYTIGSNADLPVVGGSILTHEHFQGGRYEFPMEKAETEYEFKMKKYPDISAGILNWPMSVIRLRSDNRNDIVNACSDILDKWRLYSDESVGIIPETDNTPHNTITPIVRMRNGIYEIDLVLRNNRTSEDRPLGIFHPNPSLHHIKKENIGLIEVMGLAVLPSRLADELEVLRKAMLSGTDLTADSKTASHTEWAKNILDSHPEFKEENSDSIIKAEVGKVFEQVLEDSGVFKRDEDGVKAFRRFAEVF